MMHPPRSLFTKIRTIQPPCMRKFLSGIAQDPSEGRCKARGAREILQVFTGFLGSCFVRCGQRTAILLHAWRRYYCVPAVVPVTTLPPSMSIDRTGSLPVTTLPPSMAVDRTGSLPVTTLPPSMAVDRTGSLPVTTLPPSMAIDRTGSLPVTTLPPSMAVDRTGSLPVTTLPPSMAVDRTGSLPVTTLPPSMAVVTWVVFVSLLTGCGSDDFSDLNRYILEVKTRPKESIKSLPEIKVIEPFMFKPEGLRDPFKPLEQSEQSDGVDVSTASGIKPDTTRRKEELEAFPLDGLRMVGTVDMKSSLWGLVKASDGTIYRVKVGNYMGKNYGKIIRIVSDKIELMEIVPDKPGTWREQPASIALTE